MLVMGIASVLVIREFHVEYRLTANNYLFFLGSPLYLMDSRQERADRGRGHRGVPGDRVPVRLFPHAAAASRAAHHADAGDPAVLDQLSAARLCVDDDPGRARADQSRPAWAGHPRRAGAVPALQQLCGGTGLGLSLHPVLRAGALHGARAARHVAVQRGDGSRRAAATGVPARHAAADAAGRVRLVHLRLHSRWSANTSRPRWSAARAG